MTSLLALCKPPAGAVTVRRVEITRPLQRAVARIFDQQATEFLDGIDEEVAFVGDYKPTSDEILVLDAPEEFELMVAALDGAIHLETIDADNFSSEHIKGLFVIEGEGAAIRVLIQAFTAQQILTQKTLAFILRGDTFQELTEPSFTLDSKLVAVAEQGQLKFKSFHFLKRIFDLERAYEVATDQQIDAFCEHGSLVVADLPALKIAANQSIRRLISAVHNAAVLDRSPVTEIHAKAAALGVGIAIENDRIVLPAERRSLKELLRFLDESIYEGPLSARRLVASGKRPFGPMA